MAFIVKKKISGNDYFYLNETRRVDGKVKAKTLAYLGKTKEDAEKAAKKFLEKTKNEKEDYFLEKNFLSVDELASFCKRKGFVYPSAEIYGGISGFWDFGVLGRDLKENIKKEWWTRHVRKRDDVTGLDGAIITSPKVWDASGHLKSFTDYIVKNKKTKEVFKVDLHELQKYENDNYEIEGEFRPMFETSVGPYKKSEDVAYLRPETAQLIFTNFKNIFEADRMRFPFGIAQIGKAFRNEISPREFLFRSREFEQMEMEYFIRQGMKCPYKITDVKIRIMGADGKDEVMKISDALKNKIIKLDWHAYWLGEELSFFKELDCDMDNFRLRQHSKKELAHYSTDCWDIEYNFPFGWRELEGIADRGTHDLSSHEKASKKDLKIFDEEVKEKVLGSVVCEPSLGVDRAFLVFLFEAMKKNKKNETILKLNPKLSPVKAAVFPIVKKEEFEKISREVVEMLRGEGNVNYDKSGSIGRRYARNDEIGTPYCITVDGDSLKNKDVTIRDRNTTKQIRVKIKDLKDVFRKLINSEVEFEKCGKVLK